MTRLRTLGFCLAILSVATAAPGCGDCESSSTRTSTLEETYTYAVSHIFISRKGKEPTAVFEEALSIMKELDEGAAFADVARRRSNNKEGGERGGWIGFIDPDQTTFGGAVQALPQGVRSGPVAVEEGYQILFRHTLEQARALERKYTIPVYGLFLPWGEGEGAGATRQATEELARAAWEKVVSGELTLAEAADEFGAMPPPRTDCFIANVGDHGLQAEIHAGVKDTRPGEVAPLHEISGAFAVLKRGVYYRSVIRHILVQHLDSKQRALTVTRTRADAKALAEEVLAKVRADPSTWADAVLRYSDEATQHVMKGGIGVVTNGEMVPVIEAAILETRPGSIVDHVVESEGGFHVLWRVN